VHCIKLLGLMFENLKHLHNKMLKTIFSKLLDDVADGFFFEPVRLHDR